MSKLQINEMLVESCRETARVISSQVQSYIDGHTTVAVERTVCRLLGVDGIRGGVPLPNIVVDTLVEHGLLSEGAARFFGRCMLQYGLDPGAVADQIYDGRIRIDDVMNFGEDEIAYVLEPQVEAVLVRIRDRSKVREDFLSEWGDKEGTLLYVIVATGNVREDAVQAVAAARQGADIIAVIRTTGQSLLDYVPYGETTEGFGGTYATQENFRIMRRALDEAGKELGRYIRLCNYCSGLCMPEIAAMGAFEGLDMMLNDALYGILFRDINMKRTLVDQFFSRIINGYAGVIINTGEDNYLTTSDAYEEAHTVLASQFINEQLGLKAGLKEELIGLGHAFEMDPKLEDSFVYELAQAMMVREIFPKAPLKYMPPTKHMTGDIFMGNVQDALFNMVTTLTDQKIHLLGMLTEAIHTPFLSDRAIAIENARYIQRSMKSLRDEIRFKNDGIMVQRANEVLKEAYGLLLEIKEMTLFKSLEEGVFAGVKRLQDKGKGLEGVVGKSVVYMNPFSDRMLECLMKEGPL